MGGSGWRWVRVVAVVDSGWQCVAVVDSGWSFRDITVGPLKSRTENARIVPRAHRSTSGSRTATTLRRWVVVIDGRWRW